MPDAPDDFEYSDVGEFTANLDGSELASRLYSPAIYARTGQILYMTDFTRGFSGFTPEEGTPTSTISIVPDNSMYGGLCAKFNTDSEYEGNCYVGITIPYINARYYIFDLGYYLFIAGTKARIELYIINEGVRHHFDLFHTFETFKLELLDDNGDYIDITSLENSDSYFGSYNHLRVVLDTETRLIKKFSLNNVEFALTDFSYNIASVSNVNCIQSYFGIWYEGLTSGNAYLQWLVIAASDNQ